MTALNLTPGWYHHPDHEDDESGWLRWFDGTTWTDQWAHIVDAAPAGTEPRVIWQADASDGDRHAALVIAQHHRTIDGHDVPGDLAVAVVADGYRQPAIRIPRDLIPALIDGVAHVDEVRVREDEAGGGPWPRHVDGRWHTPHPITGRRAAQRGGHYCEECTSDRRLVMWPCPPIRDAS